MGALHIILDRRAAVLALAAFAAPAARAACRARVLFICQYGTVKSPMAREVLRRQARARGADVLTRSRGLTPADHATPAFLAAARADGLDPRAEPVQALASADTAWADLTVSFEPPARAGLAGARDWSDLPSFGETYPAAHRELEARIGALLDEIARRPCP